MTQKELNYLEDAIGHEENIIKICSETISYLEDDDLIDFMNKEVKNHSSIKNKLMNLMEEKCNEWSIIDG